MGSVTPMVVPGVERLVTREELAAIMGVHPATVDRLRRDGMPSVVIGRRARRFRPSVALAWAAARKGSHTEVSDVGAEAPVRSVAGAGLA